MQLFRGYYHSPGPIAATIGNFDGVHLGHQAMLAQLKAQAIARGLPLAVILFEPQPAEFFHPIEAPARLFSLREKLEALRSCGVDYSFCLKFNHTVASIPAKDFASKVLFGHLQARYLLVGKDFRYGHKREGNYRSLKAAAESASAAVDAFADFTHQGPRVSSTRIRAAVAEGDFETAKALLGRPYRLCGRVLHGAKRGREWGIPTANLAISRHKLPLQGVFHVKVYRENGSCIPAVANLGTRPTVDGTKAFLEVHLLNFAESIYGERLQVEFLHKARDEIKFSSVEALIAQIRCDIQSSYKFFALQPPLINKEK